MKLNGLQNVTCNTFNKKKSYSDLISLYTCLLLFINSAYVEAIKLTSYTVQGLYKYIHTLIIFTKETSIEAFIDRREKKVKVKQIQPSK